MATFDFTPLFRSTVGFDRMTRLMDSALQGAEQSGGYPPYNIESVDEDRYRITVAVSGFGSDDLEVTAKQGTLVVEGRHKETVTTGKYLHRGIAGRPFERVFQLADHIEVVGADLENGLLSIDLAREVPEALKPRTIQIETGDGRTALESKAA
jgi:molecular chaperone IbpA